jgi:hypothetical protein
LDEDLYREFLISCSPLYLSLIEDFLRADGRSWGLFKSRDLGGTSSAIAIGCEGAMKAGVCRSISFEGAKEGFRVMGGA